MIERDETTMPESADQAFFWDRRGAPQVRHSHAFLARLRNILVADYPDIHAALLAEGATEIRFGESLPPTLEGFEVQAADAELTMIACRRTTFEWVVRRAVLADGGVTVHSGVGVAGLVVAPTVAVLADGTAEAVRATGTDGTNATSDVGCVAEANGTDSVANLKGDDLPRRPSRAVGGPPVVTGVRLDDGTELSADLVVVAGGRRSALPDWLAALGCGPVAEEVEDTGIVYFSRFYRLIDGAEPPPRDGPIGADLGYLKYGVFLGDNRTVSITLATSVDDADLRRKLAHPEVFDRCARSLVATQPWLDGRAVPLTDEVYVMAGLLNRWRDYVIDGVPLALGVLPVGDAVLCTNPLYGRGCSTGFWGAQILAEAVHEHGDDLTKLALAYDARVRQELLPWYRSTVVQDADARRVATAILAGEDPDGDTSDPQTFMRAVFRDGLLPALRFDAVVLRAFVRTFNLLSTPDAMVSDSDVMNRVFAIWQDRDNRPPESLLGPKHRSELLELLAA